MEVGGVGPGVSEFLCVWKIKSSQNSPKPVLIFWSSIPCEFCVYNYYTLLKIVGYYDLSVLSMSVIGFQKKEFRWGGWALGGVSSVQFFFDFFKLCKAPKTPHD